MLELFMSLVLWLAASPQPKYEVWLTPKAGGPARKYSDAPTREVADKVAAALKVAGTVEIKPSTLAGGGGGTAPGGPGTNPGTGPGNGTEEDYFTVSPGQMTFDAEGTEGGPYHSRTPSVPTNSSGLTIGRGYDMKEKTAAKIKSDLLAAGLSDADATAYSGAAGLSGAAARKYIVDHKLTEITPKQQKKLFVAAYAEKMADVQRICEKADVVKKYGATDWAKLSPAIKELVTDLIYRGDYTGGTRTFLQPLIVANDVAGLAAVMADQTKWSGVPAARFEARKQFMAAAAKK